MSRSLVPVLHTCTSKMAAERSLLFAFYWRALISCEIKWIMPAKVKVRVLSARDLPVMHRSSDLGAVRHYDRSKLHRSWIDLSSHLSIYTQGGGDQIDERGAVIEIMVYICLQIKRFCWMGNLTVWYRMTVWYRVKF